MSALILLGHWLDMFLLIMPSVFESNEHPLHGFSLAELGVFSFMAGAFIFVVLNQLQKASLVPGNHPYFKESVHHEC